MGDILRAGARDLAHVDDVSLGFRGLPAEDGLTQAELERLDDRAPRDDSRVGGRRVELGDHVGVDADRGRPGPVDGGEVAVDRECAALEGDVRAKGGHFEGVLPRLRLVHVIRRADVGGEVAGDNGDHRLLDRHRRDRAVGLQRRPHFLLVAEGRHSLLGSRTTHRFPDAAPRTRLGRVVDPYVDEHHDAARNVEGT